MAWTTKSDRFGAGTGNAASAAAHIGPGHYRLADTVKVGEHGYAPFGSTAVGIASKEADRFGMGMGSPGPGAYGAPQLPGRYDSGLPKRHVPLGGSAIRIDTRNVAARMDFRPGPGTYQVDPSLAPPEASRTMGMMPSAKPMLRSSSAPSIPQSHQSYGYEEVGGGRLARQGPKDASLFCSGRPGDSAGPGQYQANFEAVRPRQCGGTFQKGPARVPLDGGHGDQAPGPGHYVAKSSLEIKSNSYNVGSSFASGTVRGPSKREEKRNNEGPGPCTYQSDARARKPDLREIRSELQYFGSTVERFQTASGATGAADHVGPGTYAKPNSVRVGQPNARGFCSTTDRFKLDDVKENGVPGPGDYHLPGISDDTMTGPLATYNMLGNSGGLAFGGMNKRFAYAAMDDSMPGPGYYGAPGGMTDDIEEPIEETADARGRARKRQFKASRLPGAAFASKTPKDVYTKSLVKEGNMKPPPGAYDPVLVKDQATVVRLRSKSEGFLVSKADRFQGGPLEAPKGYHMNTGPGKYSPQYITGGKRAGTFNRSLLEGMPSGGRPKGLGFDTQDKRFRHVTADAARMPGPGEYNTDPKWITKSHNCYFGDLA